MTSVCVGGRSWHDGAPVTAADVLYTVGALQADDFPGVPWLRTLWKAVKVEAPDGPEGLAIRFTLEQRLPSFLDYTTIGLLPAHLWARIPVAEMELAQLNTRPVGTGPWQMAKLTATRAELSPIRAMPAQRRTSAGWPFASIPIIKACCRRMTGRRLMASAALWPEEITARARRPDLQLFSAPLSGYTVIYLNQSNPNVAFFQDTPVRQALLYALDRQALIDTVLHGQGIVAHSPLLPGTWAYDADVPRYAPDGEKARRLLDEAGWLTPDGENVREKDGKKLSFILVGDDRALAGGHCDMTGQDGRGGGRPAGHAGGPDDRFPGPAQLRCRRGALGAGWRSRSLPAVALDADQRWAELRRLERSADR